MSTQHSQIVAGHLLATGKEFTIGGQVVVGKKRLLSFKESREMNLHPGTIAYRISLPKGQIDWEPATGLGMDVDGAFYTIGECRDLGDYYRFEIARRGR